MSRSIKDRKVLCAFLVLGVLWSLPALAVDRAAAKAAFRKAETEFKLGEFSRALVSYKAAYRADPRPEFLFNIGQCHRHLGECKQARFFFSQYLDARPLTSLRAKIAGLIRDCKPKAKPKVRVAPTPPPVKPPPAEPASTPVVPPPVVRPGLARTWAWVGLGASCALLATAGITGGLARSQNSEYQDPSTPVDQQLELRDSGRALETASWITLGVGLAAAASTAALFVLSRPRRGEAPAPPAVSVAPSRGGGALVIGGRF